MSKCQTHLRPQPEFNRELADCPRPGFGLLRQLFWIANRHRHARVCSNALYVYNCTSCMITTIHRTQQPIGHDMTRLSIESLRLFFPGRLWRLWRLWCKNFGPSPSQGILVHEADLDVQLEKNVALLEAGSIFCSVVLACLAHFQYLPVYNSILSRDFLKRSPVRHLI
jgi:hypothetical protein